MNSRILLILSGVCNAGLLAALAFTIVRHSDTRFTISRDADSPYQFINPILDCEDVPSHDSSIILTNEADAYLDRIKKQYELTDLSVYYRDLNFGPWYGYNEKITFAPASLLKVPVMIGYLKYAQDVPGALEQRFTVTESDIDSSTTALTIGGKRMEVGKNYTAREVLEYLIQESDNAGVGVLMRAFDEKWYTDSVFRSVGVKRDDLHTTIAVKDYASFFRVLYNATYLEKASSEQALQMLSRSSFKDGLVAGVPKSVAVAHKFGERTVSTEGMSINGIPSLSQFHDCGIIYYPKHPYLLCVMTRGTDYRRQIPAIAEVSKYFYEEISKKTSR
jgi:beta-lactamase class A